MNLPPLTGRVDLEPFAQDLLNTRDLWELVDAFGSGLQGISQRSRDLEHLVLSGSLEDPVELAQARRLIAQWNSVPPTAPLPHSGIRERLAWLSAFAAYRWDFRLGKERDFIPTSDELMRKEVAERVYSVARRWDLMTPAPAQGEFDHIIVLGGLLTANFNRSKAAAELLAAESATTRSIVGLGTPRLMSHRELDLARSLRIDATTEQSGLERGLEVAFGFGREAWQATWRPNVREACLGDRLTVRSAGAPTNRDGTRANTGQAFEWFMIHSGLVRPSQSVLSVTTPIYWIAGHVSLITLMPPGARLTTVGADPARAVPGLEQDFRSQHYLQEIKAAIDALARALPPIARGR